MSLSKERSPYLPQIATIAVTIALSVGLTLAALRIFPDRLLPAYSPSSSADLPAPASRGTIDRITAANSQPHYFVTAAVNRVRASVMRIDTEKTIKTNIPILPVAPLGDSDRVQVGDWAISVGNPFGLDNTVTLGIVSTIKRSSAQVGIPDKRLDFIQTDAAINPSNSGGSLLNDRGEVIAINTAMRAEAQGIGFAIPIDTAKAIKDRLARGEKILHPYLGIRMLTLTPAVAKQLNNEPNKPFTAPEISGVLVVQVLPDSPAAKAGLRLGDTIVEMEGQAVTTADRLQDLVAKSRIGQPLQLKVQRDLSIERLSIRPTELQQTPQD
jgi:S1-C subfamily serine protease